MARVSDLYKTRAEYSATLIPGNTNAKQTFQSLKKIGCNILVVTLEGVLGNGQNRWEKILGYKTKLWQAINWCGEIRGYPGSVDSKPADEVFKDYLAWVIEYSLYLDGNELLTGVTIDVLHKPSTPNEAVKWEDLNPTIPVN